MIVVHFDHQQRGTASDDDRRFIVQTLCRQYSIPCYTYYWNDAATEIFTGYGPGRMFSQDLARPCRRRTMQQLATELIRKRQLQADNNNTNHTNNNDGNTRQVTYIGMITTAHHKNDSEETILLKLLRGVHISNIAGRSIVQQCPNAASSISTTATFAAITGSAFHNVDDENGANMGVRNNDTLIYWVQTLLIISKSACTVLVICCSYTCTHLPRHHDAPSPWRYALLKIPKRGFVVGLIFLMASHFIFMFLFGIEIGWLLIQSGRWSIITGSIRAIIVNGLSMLLCHMKRCFWLIYDIVVIYLLVRMRRLLYITDMCTVVIELLEND